MPNQIHVVPNPEGGWDIKKEGSDKALDRAGTRKVALMRAREIAKKV